MICVDADPGRVLADASIFISCAMTLSVFNILKYSENGVAFEPDTGHTAGIITVPFESLRMSHVTKGVPEII